MPIKVLESNNRVAEVQFVCDECGELVRTCLVAREEVKALEGKKIVCAKCKNRQPDKQSH